MGTYLLRRLAQIVPTVVGVSIVIFVLVRVLPGDPAGLLFTPGTSVSPEALAQIRHDMGLDLPMWDQYVVYVGRAVHGDLGRSYQTNAPVAEQIARAAPATLELAVAGLLVAVVIGVTAGVLSAVRQHTLLDYGTIVGPPCCGRPTARFALIRFACAEPTYVDKELTEKTGALLCARTPAGTKATEIGAAMGTA